MSAAKTASDIRPLLVFGSREILGLSVEDLSEGGWTPYLARVPREADEHLRHHSIRTALVFLEPSRRALKDLEAVLCREGRNVQIVAIIDPQDIREKALRRFVAHCCFDYHSLPLDIPRLLHSLGHADGVAIICQDCLVQRPMDEMIGASPMMLEMFRQIRKAATVDAPVLITGETGTGKELAALAIHEQSTRAKGPFIAVNCGAIPENLIQAELFGHEKGAFTGAHERKIGKIEAAATGTLFLDEIGDLPYPLQVNLLRFLQEQRFERVGSTESLRADVRIIAATHMDLDRAVTERRFREDLYYRLNVLRIHTPALRDREGDSALLAKYFFRRFAAEKNPKVKDFSQQALAIMGAYAWPGNVRELINRVRRAIVMSDHALIGPEDLGLDGQIYHQGMSLDEARERAERQAIIGAIHAHRKNISEAARALGVARVTLYRLMDKYDIEP